MINRIIFGIVFIVIGFAIILFSFFSEFAPLVFGILVLILGIVILLNRGEDKIEERKDTRKGTSKK